jgi:LmbE family N-acetylglucosaminyl deacetylase
MNSKKILFSLAHPDDESFGSGALIGRYVSEGADVYYIVGTDGAAGTVAPEYIEKFGSVKAVRASEMACAAKTLGFKEVFDLGYGDSGMMGSEDNNNPTCLWQADETEVTGKIVKILREVQPQVVITFDKFGGYGHPDHIFMHRATTRAFIAASDPDQFPEAGPAYSPQKLYYGRMPRALIRFFILMIRLQGQNPRQIGVNKDMDMIAVAQNIPPLTTQIDVAKWMHVWEAASACHASQMSPATTTPRLIRQLIWTKQGLTRVYPSPKPRARLERDLFDSVTL